MNEVLGTSLAGLAAIALWLGWRARSAADRLARMRDAVRRIAAGNPELPSGMAATDDLAGLASAFDTLRQQLGARERALATVRNELEQRVERRTSELNDANLRLLYEIAERNAAEEQLRLLSMAVEQTPVSILITDVAGNIQYVNRAFVESTGYAREEVLGRKPNLLKSGLTPACEYERLWQDIMAGRQWEGDFQTRRRDGTLFWERVHISPITDGEGRISHFLSVRQNVSERKAQEEVIRRQAHYDGLTSLPNRLLAMDRLAQAIHVAERSGEKIVLMFVDLDDFKKVNDTLGHDAGDDLLIQAALRLSESVRSGDTVGRHGGDEFLVIMSGLASAAEAEVVARRIIEAFQLPFIVAGQEVTVSASIGLASYPDDAAVPAVLLRYADLAMYDAKESGRNMYRYFDQASHDQTIGYLDFERTLRSGLAREEFWLAYQPLVEARSGRLLGVEALLRWNSPQYGMVAPDRFIPVAERNSFIVELGSWVLTTACSIAMHWMQAGYPPFVVSVNVSPLQFRGGGLLGDVRQCLRSTGLPPECLQIEITEGVLMQKRPEVEAVLRGLDELGVRLALDDFGTGYASLSYLKRFPFHTLKIDREFVRDLDADESDRALVTAAIRMGKALELSVVAEGVESREQAQWLADAGCDSLQGYVFDPPLTAEQLEERWLRVVPAVTGTGSAVL